MTDGVNEYPNRPPTREEALARRLAGLGQQRVARSSTGDGPGTGPTAPTGPNRRSRRHPAGRARAAAIGLSLASTAGLTAFFAAGARDAPKQVTSASIVAASAGSPTASAPANGSSSTVTTTPAAADAAATTTTTTATAAPATASTAVDGGVFQNRWGLVQVEATFGADGKLASVTAVKTPNGQGKSVQINSSAVPTLTSEALTAQSAQVDTVSGATYTSNDYRRSLQSAIDAARAANITRLT